MRRTLCAVVVALPLAWTAGAFAEEAPAAPESKPEEMRIPRKAKKGEKKIEEPLEAPKREEPKK